MISLHAKMFPAPKITRGCKYQNSFSAQNELHPLKHARFRNHTDCINIDSTEKFLSSIIVMDRRGNNAVKMVPFNFSFSKLHNPRFNVEVGSPNKGHHLFILSSSGTFVVGHEVTAKQ